MNKKWMTKMTDKELLPYGGYTTIPNILSFKRKELGITNDHIMFIFNILAHDEGWIIYDKDLEHVACNKTLRQYREELLVLGYLSWPTRYDKMTANGMRSSGFVYDLTGLFEKLEKLYASFSTDKESVSSTGKGLPSQGKGFPTEEDNGYLLTNTVQTITEQTNISNCSTIIDDIKAELPAPVTGQQHLLDEWKKLDILARKGDISNLQNFTSVEKFVPLVKYWKEFCEQDPYLCTKDYSLTLFLNSYEKLNTYVNSKVQLDWPFFVKKHHISDDEIDQFDNLGQAKTALREKYL